MISRPRYNPLPRRPTATAVTFAPERLHTTTISKRSETDRLLEGLLADHGGFLRAAIHRLCPRSLGIPEDEIEQEARIRLWRALRRDCNITDPRSYLYKVVASATIDAVRHSRSKREAQLDAGSPNSGDGHEPSAASPVSPETSAIVEELLRQMRRAIAALPKNRRRAVSLRLEGFTTQEIAGRLGWTEPKARNLVHRGLKELRGRFQRAS